MKDDSGIPAELTRKVLAVQARLRGACRDSLGLGISLGVFLAEAKETCRHGEWLDWLERNFDQSARHAQRLMLLARTYPNPKAFPAPSLREALRLIAAKKPK